MADERRDQEQEQEQEQRSRRGLRLRPRRGRDQATGSKGGGLSGTVEMPGFTVTGVGVAGLVVVAIIAGAIYLMRESDKTRVPSLVGLDRVVAETRIKSSGLTVRGIANEISSLPPATVLRTDPPGGSKVDRGAGITIVLSLGQAGAQPAPGTPSQGPGGTNNASNGGTGPGSGTGIGPGGNVNAGTGGRSGSGSGGSESRRDTPLTVTATVEAVDATYEGPCPPPQDATTYQATITVSTGPTTVNFRWTTSNGGATDPSTKTITFPGTGRQSRTVTYNENSYLPDQTVNDWVAVNLISPRTGQSNRASYTMTCTPAAPG
jgi:hypothetical protein